MSQTRASLCELKPYYCFQNRGFDYQQKRKKRKTEECVLLRILCLYFLHLSLRAIKFDIKTKTNLKA